MLSHMNRSNSASIPLPFQHLWIPKALEKNPIKQGSDPVERVWITPKIATGEIIQSLSIGNSAPFVHTWNDPRVRFLNMKNAL